MKVTVSLVAVLIATSYAVACSCMMPPPPPKALEQAAAVFSGKVTKIDANQGHRKTITLSVDRTWKGIDTETVTLTTGSGGGDCGYGFKDGEAYLVYAYRGGDEENGPLGTSICSRTRPIADAKEDLEALGEGKKIEPKK
jgi:hypothetical protein